MPCYPFLGEGSPTKIDYRKKGTLILTSLLEDLDKVSIHSETAYLGPHGFSSLILPAQKEELITTTVFAGLAFCTQEKAVYQKKYEKAKAKYEEDMKSFLEAGAVHLHW